MIFVFNCSFQSVTVSLEDLWLDMFSCLQKVLTLICSMMQQEEKLGVADFHLKLLIVFLWTSDVIVV